MRPNLSSKFSSHYASSSLRRRFICCIWLVIEVLIVFFGFQLATSAIALDLKSASVPRNLVIKTVSLSISHWLCYGTKKTFVKLQTTTPRSKQILTLKTINIEKTRMKIIILRSGTQSLKEEGTRCALLVLMPFRGKRPSFWE